MVTKYNNMHTRVQINKDHWNNNRSEELGIRKNRSEELRIRI